MKRPEVAQKIIEMLQSKDEEMQELGKALCERLPRDMGDLDKIVVLLHGDGNECKRAFELFKTIKRETKHLRYIINSIIDIGCKDHGVIGWLQELEKYYINTKKLKGDFLTQEEFEKTRDRRKWWLDEKQIIDYLKIKHL